MDPEGAVRKAQMKYSEKFKARMVQKLADPRGPNPSELSREVGVHPSTLSRWLEQAGRGNGNGMGVDHHGSGVAMTARRPQDWTAEEKLEAVVEAGRLSEGELGAFLRRKGLHEAQLKEWRKAVLAGLEKGPGRGSKRSGEAKRIRELERELGRKEKALAEAAALLVLQKKVRALWGEEDESTPPKNGSRS